jgi:hypothetical protein
MLCSVKSMDDPKYRANGLKKGMFAFEKDWNISSTAGCDIGVS